MDALRARPGLDAVVGFVLLAGFVVVTAGQGGAAANVRVFQFAYLMGFAGYLLIVRSVLRDRATGAQPAGRWPLWLAACIAMRVALLATTPSDDLYRYVWEGRIQLAGFNPYAAAPDDPALVNLRNADWLLVGHPDYPAIYPPLAQMVFAAVAAVAPTVGAMRIVFAVLDMLVVIVLTAALRRRGEPPERSLLYALCPLVLTAFAIEGHLDSLMLLPLAGALWAHASGRLRLAAVLVGLAISAKLTAGVLLPWLVLRKPKLAVIAVGVVVVTYLPYLGAGRGLAESLLRFSSGPMFMSLLHTVMTSAGDLRAVRMAAVGVLFAVCVVLAIRRRDFVIYAVGATGAMLALMPVVHAWYFTWILVWMPFAARARWIAAAAAMVVYYEAMLAQQTVGVWQLPDWAPFVVWGVWAAVWVIEVLRRPNTAIIERPGS